MGAPVSACVEAVGGQGGGRARPRADGCGRLSVADLRDRIVRLPELQFLPHKSLHLLPVGVRVPSQTLVLTNKVFIQPGGAGALNETACVSAFLMI